MSEIKASQNKAKDVEQPRPAVYKLPENLRQALINYVANSIPRAMTVQEALNLATALQQLRKV